MKNTLLLQLCMLLAFIAKAQIVHEHSYFTDNLSLVKLEFSGYKYAVVDTYIHLYNLDHSLYKQIAIPAQPEMGYCRIGYVTEKLFNTDSTDIEYLLVGSGSSTPPYIKVYSEQGATLFSKDLVGQYSSLGINAGGIIQETIFNTSEGAKMRLVTGQGSYIDSVHIFSLPGYLECSPCGQQSGIAGISGITANAGFLSAAPNPANSFTRITYKLPDGAYSGDIVIYSMLGQELKRYPVNKANEYLTLSLMDLATGTYLYSLQVEGKQPTAKQIVVIR